MNHVTDHLARDLHNALCCYLRLEKENMTNFDVNDPVPEKDKEYGCKNDGFHEIFNITKHDKGFVKPEQMDVVADGNSRITRKVHRDEKRMKKGYLRPGRRSSKINQKGKKFKSNIR